MVDRGVRLEEALRSLLSQLHIETPWQQVLWVGWGTWERSAP